MNNPDEEEFDSSDEDEYEDQFIHTSADILTVVVHHYFHKYILKNPCMVSSQTGNKWLREVLLGHESRCYNAFRMDKDVFLSLCGDLENNFEALGSKRVSHMEVVGMVVHILGHGCGNRSAQERFQHSGETISRYFGQAVDVLNMLAKEMIKPAENQFNGVAPEIMRDQRYMPHFKDCIGAIDGVHIPASISPSDQVPYIGRKGIPTQNVMAACDFDMQFIFVCAGWEGSAHDTRVFMSALQNAEMNFPNPPPGKYYVVDAGYPQMNGFLGPYKGSSQHFQEYRRREPRNAREEFNRAHSSLRGVIERTFGCWKKKWKILRDMQGYPFPKQVKIVIATMVLHNYIRKHAPRDKHFHHFEQDDTRNGEIDDADDDQQQFNVQGAQQMNILRDNIAQSLMMVRNDRA